MSDLWARTSFGKVARRRTETWSPGDPEATYVGLEHISPYELRLLGAGVSTTVSSNKTRFLAHDVLFGKLRPYFQKVVRPSFPGVCSTDIWALYPADDSLVDPGFLHWVVADPSFSDFANSAETGTRMPRASWQWVSTYELALPPLEEQRRIGEVLSVLDDRISQARRIRELLAHAAHCVLAMAPSTCSVAEVASAERIQWYPQKHADQVVDHYSLPAFDTRGEPERVSALEIASNKFLVREPRVLFSRLNPDTNRTWLCVPSGVVDASVCSTEYAVLAPRGTSVNLLWAAMSSGEVGGQLAAATTGTSASHQRVNEEAVLGSSIGDPRALAGDEQESVESYVDAFLEKGNEIRLMREARDFLLPRLVSGELRVAAAEEIAEAAT